MTNRDIYIMGRAEALSEYDGIGLIEATEIAAKEFDENEKGWTIVYTPWEDESGKPRVAGRFKTTKAKDDFLKSVSLPDSGWLPEEIATFGIINDYNYILSL